MDCPVCGRRIQGDVEQLERHVNQCLDNPRPPSPPPAAAAAPPVVDRPPPVRPRPQQDERLERELRRNRLRNRRDSRSPSPQSQLTRAQAIAERLRPSYGFGAISIKVVEAEGLSNPSLFGSPDPYAIIKFEGYELRGEPVSRTTNPRFIDTEATFSVHEYYADSAVTVELWAKRPFVQGASLGSVSVRMSDITAVRRVLLKQTQPAPATEQESKARGAERDTKDEDTERPSAAKWVPVDTSDSAWKGVIHPFTLDKWLAVENGQGRVHVQIMYSCLGDFFTIETQPSFLCWMLRANHMDAVTLMSHHHSEASNYFSELLRSFTFDEVEFIFVGASMKTFLRLQDAHLSVDHMKRCLIGVMRGANEVMFSTIRRNAFRQDPIPPADLTQLIFAALEHPDAASILQYLRDEQWIGIGSKPDGTTITHAAAKLGQPDAMRVILAHRGPADRPNAVGQTPLHIAVGNSTAAGVATAALLVEERVRLLSRDASGKTPLDVAIATGHKPMIDMLTAAIKAATGAAIAVPEADPVQEPAVVSPSQPSQVTALPSVLSLPLAKFRSEVEESDTEYEYNSGEEAEQKNTTNESTAQLPVDLPDLSQMRAPVFARQRSVEVWEEEQVAVEQIAKVREVANVLQLPLTAAGSLLVQFSWELDRLVASFYEDRDRTLQAAQVRLSTASQLLDNMLSSEDGDCAICFDTFPANQLYGLACQHRFCRGCWSDHLATALSSFQWTCVTRTVCPHEGCGLVVDELMWTELAPADVHQKYERFLVQSFVKLNPQLAWCPNATCGRAVRYAGGRSYVTCSCGTAFCFSCQREPHGPLSCASYARFQQERVGVVDAASYQMLMKNFKRCPKCNVYIERNEGCNHMTCRREYGGCGFEFCYMCKGPWSEHGSSTGGYYHCNKYDREKKSMLQYENYTAEEMKRLESADQQLNVMVALVQKIQMSEGAIAECQERINTLHKKVAPLLGTAGDRLKQALDFDAIDIQMPGGNKPSGSSTPASATGSAAATPTAADSAVAGGGDAAAAGGDHERRRPQDRRRRARSAERDAPAAGGPRSLLARITTGVRQRLAAFSGASDTWDAFAPVAEAAQAAPTPVPAAVATLSEADAEIARTQVKVRIISDFRDALLALIEFHRVQMWCELFMHFNPQTPATQTELLKFKQQQMRPYADELFELTKAGGDMTTVDRHRLAAVSTALLQYTQNVERELEIVIAV